MADQLNMNGLNLGNGPEAPNGQGNRSYIPPHMRGKMPPPAAQGPPPAMAGVPPTGPPGPPPGPPGPGGPPMAAAGLNNSAWAG